ncbi:hypothetical protein MKK69_07305 [Methylobacterium sp. J-026]|nr:hypothetical protein [Methylobacterium sp. J-026]
MSPDVASCTGGIVGIPYLVYQVAKRHDIYRIATYGLSRRFGVPPMIASFALIFVAFAACQAVLTVKFADFVSPAGDSDRAAAAPARAVGSARLA